MLLNNCNFKRREENEKKTPPWWRRFFCLFLLFAFCFLLFLLLDGCPGLCYGNGRCTLDQNGWHCVCQVGWSGSGCNVVMEMVCGDNLDNDGGMIHNSCLCLFVTSSIPTWIYSFGVCFPFYHRLPMLCLFTQDSCSTDLIWTSVVREYTCVLGVLQGRIYVYATPIILALECFLGKKINNKINNN